MKIIKCSRCGNAKDFYETLFVIQHKYFHQQEDGRIYQVNTEQRNMPNHNSRIYCSDCDQEIEEDYDLFLDRYSETIFEKI